MLVLVEWDVCVCCVCESHLLYALWCSDHHVCVCACACVCVCESLTFCMRCDALTTITCVCVCVCVCVSPFVCAVMLWPPLHVRGQQCSSQHWEHNCKKEWVCACVCVAWNVTRVNSVVDIIESTIPKRVRVWVCECVKFEEWLGLTAYFTALGAQPHEEMRFWVCAELGTWPGLTT